MTGESAGESGQLSGFALAGGKQADGKDDGAFRTIGEVAARFGIRQHVLRYWEEQFPMLRPLKRAGGRRYYRPEDLALVAEINRLLNDEGFTIRGARQALEGGGVSPPAKVAVTQAPLPQDIAQQPALADRLRNMRKTLATALDESAPVHR